MKFGDKLAIIAAIVMLIVALIFAFWADSAFSYTYYVSSDSGNDSRTSTQARNAATPWATLGHACSTFTRGDTILLEGGTYSQYITSLWSTYQGGHHATINIPTSKFGYSNDWTCIKTAPGYAKALIRGNNDYTLGGATVDRANPATPSYVCFDSLIFRHVYQGIYAIAKVKVINCDFDSAAGYSGNNNGFIILDGGDSLWVENCTFKHVLTGSFLSGCLTFVTASNYMTIYNNVFDSIPIDPNAAIWFKQGGSHNNNIYNNTFRNITTSGIYLQYATTHNSIRNNIFYHCNIGLNWFPYYYNTGDSVYNNTFYDVDSVFWLGFRGGSYAHNDVDSIVFFNNIICNVGYRIYSVRNETDGNDYFNVPYINYNCYYNFGSNISYWSNGSAYRNYSFIGWQDSLDYDTNSVNSYPVFTDTANHDFTLTGSSPAAVLSGGRGGSFETYMGAYAPAESAPVTKRLMIKR